MKSKNRKVLGPNTKINHPKKVELPEGNLPTISPIYQTAKFVVSETESYGDQFIYTRINNPTTRQLEINLAEVQNKEDCIVVSSGIAAITGMMLALLKQGDHVIAFREAYKPGRIFVRDILPQYGIESSIISITNLDVLESQIKSNTKLIHFESPTNPNLDIADIDKILSIAKKHNILVSMDGTFAGIHQHTNYPIDIMIQSLTKFGNGHGDVIVGSIAGSSEMIKKIRSMTTLLGATLDPHASYLVERGLKTYFLRYEKQTKNASEIATYLSQHPKIKKVFYPGLETHTGHQLAKKQMKEMGAVISFIIDPSVAESAAKFCHKLNLVQFAVSLGATETLIAPTLQFFGDDLNENEREAIGITKYSIRLSVGLEDAQDIIRDLDLALTGL
jgi:methionine-gamma-lyase